MSSTSPLCGVWRAIARLSMVLIAFMADVCEVEGRE